MRRWVALMLTALAACGGSQQPGEVAEVPATPAAVCPALRDAVSEPSSVSVWPSPETEDLVPELDGLCATPVSAHLFGLLYEDAVWTNELESAALGILHRDGAAVATFSALRVKEGTPGLEDVSSSAGGATTKVDDLTVSWGRAGEYVYAFWIDGTDVVTLSGPSPAGVVDSAEQWLGIDDVAVPEDIPEVTELATALAMGPPVENIPDGYQALVMDGLAFMRSDFADAVTIHDEKNIEALGAAVIISQDGSVIGTVVAGRGYGEGVGRWPEETEGAASGGFGDVPADGFHEGGVDALIVGYDESEVDAFMSAWKQALARRPSG